MNKLKFTLVLILVALIVTPIASAANNPESSLYATRLQSVSVPKAIQEESVKKIGATLSSTYVYVVLVCDGKPVWISPKQKLIINQTRFEWPNVPESTAVFLWKKNTNVSVRVFLSDDKTEAFAIDASLGAGAGAGAGALIGGTLAGIFTGGLAAPAGALIGAAIGGGAGAVAGGATGALSANDRILFEVDCLSKNTFPLNGTLKHAKNILGEVMDASATFKLFDVKSPLQQGTLKVGEKYVVHMQAMKLSAKAALKGGKNYAKSKYYIVFQQGSNKYTFLKDEPISITPDIEIKPEIYTILKNTGASTQVHVYEHDLMVDDLVFTSTVGKIDGKSWVFIGKVQGDDVGDSSYMVFDTFGPLK